MSIFFTLVWRWPACESEDMGENRARSQIECHIEPFDLHSAYFDGANWVFMETWHRFREDTTAYFERHISYPGFLGLVGLVDGRIVGMGFGTHSERGQWWHDKVAEQVGAKHSALQDAWVLTEL